MMCQPPSIGREIPRGAPPVDLEARGRGDVPSELRGFLGAPDLDLHDGGASHIDQSFGPPRPALMLWQRLAYQSKQLLSLNLSANISPILVAVDEKSNSRASNRCDSESPLFASSREFERGLERSRSCSTCGSSEALKMEALLGTLPDELDLAGADVCRLEPF